MNIKVFKHMKNTRNKEQGRLRQQKYREKKKSEKEKSDITVTLRNGEEENKEKNKEEKRKEIRKEEENTNGFRKYEM